MSNSPSHADQTETEDAQETTESDTQTEVDEEARQYYINALMHDVDKIKRKSFRRLILLRYVIEFEGQEAHGPAWQEWLDEKEEHVTPSFGNFVYALDVSLVREMRPTAELLCSEDDVDFLYDASNDTLREYVKTLRALLI